MILRQILEDNEKRLLSPFAQKSSLGKGRGKPEEKCPLRTDYQRDRDRIIHCKAFRRLTHKTQVFISPEGDHYRTRLTHTLEVSQIARTLARSLALNEDLAEAIALGHDLGHTPFGHTGEAALNEAMPMGFAHNEQSVRTAEVIEGLNLTFETLDGMRNHRSSGSPSTLEGQCVRLADKIAYVNHDIDDAIRAGALKPDDLPAEPRRALGSTGRERVGFLLADAAGNSEGKEKVSLSPGAAEALGELRNFLFENVYASQIQQKEREKIRHVVLSLYERCLDAELLPAEYARIAEEGGRARAAGDYVAGMTDRYALRLFSDIYMPASWQF
jgi:dGTPase